MERLVAHPLLDTLADLLRKFPETGSLHLVGGALRDTLLDRSPLDFDLTARHDPTPLAKAFAAACGGHWFWLDEPRRQSRVLIGPTTCDFAPWRAATLAGDLAARDFTINAMALDLSNPASRVELIDPLGGRSDLNGKVLRLAGPSVLSDDPLRILKGVRHAAELGLQVEPATLAAMRRTAPALSATAPERIRIEFWRLLAAVHAPMGFDLLAQTGVGAALFGRELTAQDAARMAAAWRTAQANLAALCARCPAAGARLAEPVEQGLDRAGLLLFAIVVGTLDPDLPAALLRTWRCGRAAVRRITALASAASLPWHEVQIVPRRVRTLALWAMQYGPDPRDLLLYAVLDSRSAGMIPAPVAIDCFAALESLDEPGTLSPRVDGALVAERLGLSGPALGRALAAVRRAEMFGVIGTAEEAVDFLLRTANRVDKH